MRKRRKNKIPYLTQVMKKLAPRVGARIIAEPEWQIAAQIIYPNGVVRSTRMYSLDLNHIASSDIAKDKDYAKFFMKKQGYPVAEGKTIFRDSFAEIIKSNRRIAYGVKYAEKLGFPVIAKPNSGSQGTGVHLVFNKKELRSALIKILAEDRIALIEKYLPGRDYRVVVLDGEIISAYERIPLSVAGDGESSILALLKKKQVNFVKRGRDTRINFEDPRIRAKLRREGYTLRSVLEKNEKIFLLDNANLSAGGDSVDVTKKIHQGIKKIAIYVTKKMGLRIAGVDIMVTEGDITKNPKNSKYYIIEINAAPGLDHYVTTGKHQRKIVEDMYLKVLRALGKR